MMAYLYPKAKRKEKERVEKKRRERKKINYKLVSKF